MTTTSTEAGTVADVARESQRFGQVIDPDLSEIHINVLNEDEQLEVCSYEQFLSIPRRPRGTTTVTEVGSFATLLRRAEHEGSVIFAHETEARLTAVINYDAGWRDHRVVLQLAHSEQYRRWIGADNKLLPQSTFAEFIEDGLAEIIEPDAADMMELAQSFEATKSVQFESGRRINNGAVRFRYLESIDATAGSGDITVPTSFLIALPIWRGGESVQLRANLRYSIGRDGLKLGYKLMGRDEMDRLAFIGVVEDLRTRLGLTDTEQSSDEQDHTIVIGPAPHEINPLP